MPLTCVPTSTSVTGFTVPVAVMDSATFPLTIFTVSNAMVCLLFPLPPKMKIPIATATIATTAIHTIVFFFIMRCCVCMCFFVSVLCRHSMSIVSPL